MPKSTNYLKNELYQLIHNDPSIFDFLHDGSLDGIWYWDIEQPNNEWMSPRFWQTLGYDPESKQQLASEWQNLIFEEDLQIALENFKKHCENPDYPYDQVVRYQHKSGSTVWVRCRGMAIRDKHGKPIRMLGAHNELTKLKYAEMELVQRNIELEKLNKMLIDKNKKIEKSNQALEQFANIVSHDLKSPLRSINMMVSMVEEELNSKISDDMKKYFELIKDCTKSMDALIEGVLAYSQVTQESETEKELDLNMVIENIQNQFRHMKSLNISYDKLPLITAGITQMQQIFGNLINNAINHADKKSIKIYISCQENDNQFQFCVADNGPGIPDNEHEKIFDIFHTIPNNNKEKSTGIGLSIVKKLVENARGKIWVTNNKGGGAAFNFTWPKATNN